MLGRFYEFGRGGLDADADEAVRFYKLAAASGSPKPSTSFAASASRPRARSSAAPASRSRPQAVQWTRRAADLGFPLAQGQLAKWYRTGECSLPTNYKEAFRLAQLGGAQGSAFSMRELGFLYGQGLGVAENHDEACTWFRQAAALGDENSKVNLRSLARSGHAPAAAAVRDLGLGPL